MYKVKLTKQVTDWHNLFADNDMINMMIDSELIRLNLIFTAVKYSSATIAVYVPDKFCEFVFAEEARQHGF